MKSYLPSLCLLAIIIFHFQNGYSQTNSLRVMTFNIRLNVASDGENAWPKRTDLVKSMIHYHSPDIMGVQEALENQMVDLKKMLPEYHAHGIARTNDIKWGEYSAIFYKRSRLTLLEGSTFWLSENPDTISTGWDAALPRIVTWGKFRDVQTGKVFFHFNTHFDHKGVKAREESARLILRKIEELNPLQLPTLVTGDFNFTPDATPYPILTKSLLDTYDHSLTPSHGPATTWSGFKEAGIPGRRIDHIFYKYNVVSLKHAILAESWSGRFPSDHLPVLAEILIDPPIAHPAAHAHNDYEHEKPLWDAWNQGFTSVEADVWFIDGGLYVSHNKPSSLDQNKTLSELYLKPLATLIDKNGHRVHAGYNGPFWLMIDIKSEANVTYQAIQKAIRPYEYLLSGSNPPVKIFLSGNRPIDSIMNDSDALIGLDGRPDDLGKGHSPVKMPVISQRYGKLISWNGKGAMPDVERKKLKSWVDKAHAEGKKLRLWASPETELAWTELFNAGVDLINTDLLEELNVFLRNRNKIRNE